MTRASATPRRTRPAALRAVGLVVLLVGAAACASVQRTMDSYATAPSGLSVTEDRLRRSLGTGRYDSALVRAARKEMGAPGDRLLRSMYAGLVAYYAGEWDRSTGAFERVHEMVEDRLTRRVSKEAASLVTNDRALPWMPTPTERLLARHYAMLAWLRKDDPGGAAVEARRLVLLLQEMDDAGTPVDRQLRALLHYVAGAVFEANGDRNDADVAFRNAAAYGIAAPVRAADDDSATVIVLVEDGWIAHKVEQSLTLAFGTRDEIATFADDKGRRARDEVIARERRAASTKEKLRQALEDEVVDEKKTDGGSADSTLQDAKEKEKRQSIRGVGFPTGSAPGGTRAPDTAPTRPGEHVGRARSAPLPPPAPDRDEHERRERTKTVTISTDVSAAERLFGLMVDQERDEWYVDRWDRPLIVRSVTDASYVLTLAWPAFARPEPAPQPMAVNAALGEEMLASDMPLHSASLSDAVVADFRRQRAAIFARSVARAATKYWLAEKAEKKEKWAGMLVNAAGDLLERADTRSWHLLPGEISLVRLRLPAGTHTLSTDVADARRGRSARVELGMVTLRAGETRVVSGRVWTARMPRPSLPVGARMVGN